MLAPFTELLDVVVTWRPPGGPCPSRRGIGIDVDVLGARRTCRGSSAAGCWGSGGRELPTSCSPAHDVHADVGLKVTALTARPASPWPWGRRRRGAPRSSRSCRARADGPNAARVVRLNARWTTWSSLICRPRCGPPGGEDALDLVEGSTRDPECPTLSARCRRKRHAQAVHAPTTTQLDHRATRRLRPCSTNCSGME